MAQNGPTALFLAATEVIDENQSRKLSFKSTSPIKSKFENERCGEIVWRNVLAFVLLHCFALQGLYMCFTTAKIHTVIFFLGIGSMAAIGVTAGAHRLWAHRCYKAKLPLRIILCIFQTMAFQNHIYEWVRDHRVHHKFTDTNADPHNSKRGFFFSHMGWLMVRKHPDVINKGRTVDMSDIEKDAVVMWQKRNYLILVPLFTFLLPSLVPYYFWSEPWWTSFLTVSILRYTISLNFTWLVNSAAHIWGMKPYDRNISACENKQVAILTFGEGWHNYHHAFPWDYKAAELGNYGFNLSTGFIDFFAKFGWAYDMKVASNEIIMQRSKNKGDGSREHHNEVWGWEDVDMSEEEKRLVYIKNKI